MMSKVNLIGTPTINDTVFPPVGHVLVYLKGLKPGPGRLWGAFGSYGWGGGGVQYVMDWYNENQYEIVAEPVESRFRPKADMLEACDRYADTVIERIKN